MFPRAISTVVDAPIVRRGSQIAEAPRRLSEKNGGLPGEVVGLLMAIAKAVSHMLNFALGV